jgi:hypothetical protein
MGLALIWVVARAVFAPGSVTYHRVMGAILLYLAHRLDIWGTFCSERSQPRLPSRRQARAVSVCRQGNGGPS